MPSLIQSAVRVRVVYLSGLDESGHPYENRPCTETAARLDAVGFIPRIGDSLVIGDEVFAVSEVYLNVAETLPEPAQHVMNVDVFASAS